MHHLHFGLAVVHPPRVRARRDAHVPPVVAENRQLPLKQLLGEYGEAVVVLVALFRLHTNHDTVAQPKDTGGSIGKTEVLTHEKEEGPAKN